ncbi:glutathione-dependent formaldehyde dehydrogenase, partial [Acinetobacter courvalinii]
LAPDAIITHRMKLDDAAEGYRIFDNRAPDFRKVILTP